MRIVLPEHQPGEDGLRAHARKARSADGTDTPVGDELTSVPRHVSPDGPDGLVPVQLRPVDAKGGADRAVGAVPLKEHLGRDAAGVAEVPPPECATPPRLADHVGPELGGGRVHRHVEELPPREPLVAQVEALGPLDVAPHVDVAAGGAIGCHAAVAVAVPRRAEREGVRAPWAGRTRTSGA